MAQRLGSNWQDPALGELREAGVQVDDDNEPLPENLNYRAQPEISGELSARSAASWPGTIGAERRYVPLYRYAPIL